MSDKVFLDTNVLVYSFDKDRPEKQRVAYDIIQTALTEGNAVISSQVAQEFLHVATRKFSEPLSADDCLLYLQTALQPLCQVFTSISLYEKKLQLIKQTNYSLYDSLIIGSPGSET